MSNPATKPCIVLIMHTPLAAAFKACAVHVLGHDLLAQRLFCFDIDPVVHIDDEVNRLLQAISSDVPTQQPILLLNDLYGATPYRIAARVCQQLRVQDMQASLLAGTSMPMLLKAITDSTGGDFAAYVQTIAHTAARGAVLSER